MSSLASRRGFLRGAATAAGAWAVSQIGCASPKRPNILFIMSDDHPNSALSCYGGKVNQTPSLDRIANEGMRFDHAYVTTSLCGPSRASILTGTYPHRNGQIAIPKLFDGSQTTFPKLLQNAGYETAIIGKWHLNTEPTGFDYWNVLIGQGAYFDPVMVDNGALREHTGYATGIITDLSIDWFRNRSGGRPFCLMCHHKAPHYVWEPDKKHEEMYADTTFPEPGTFNDTHEGRVSPRESDLNVADLHTHPLYRHWPRRNEIPEGLPPEQQKSWNYQHFMKDVIGCVASVDDNVGRLLDYLDEAGLAEDTIVVYTSDNGYFLGEHGWTDKKVIYEESIRVPLLVRYPRRVEPGSVNGDFALNIDFAPTFLDLCGVQVPAEMQGRSLRPLLSGETPDDWRDSFYYQIYHASAGTDRQLPHYGIRTHEYKLAHWYHEMDDWELYDLAKDPQELNNVYRDSSYAEAVATLTRQLNQLRAELGINEAMEQDFAAKTMARHWSQEVNEYRKRKMREWSAARTSE